jgi:membrane protease YdiL (CAAX protease family)
MLKTIKETYFELMAFLRNPKDEMGPELTIAQKFKILFSLVLLEIPLMGAFSLIMMGLEELKLVDTEGHKVVELFKSLPVVVLIILTAIIIPFFEELIFRLYLRYKNNYLLHFIISLVSLTGARNEKKAETVLTSLWKKKYTYIFYFSAILFGIVHITNYKLSYTILLLSPILIAPQILVGLFIGFLRVRYGFVWGFLLHALHNAVFVGIGILSMSHHSEIINTETRFYSIKIEETNDFHGSSTLKNYPDSIAYKNVNLKTTLSNLLLINEILIGTNDEKQLNKTINFNFKNKSKDSSLTKDIALNQLAKSYNFKIKKNKVSTKVWDLKISNPDLFLKCKSKNNSSANLLTIKPTQIVIEHATLSSLVYALTNQKKEIVYDKTDSEGVYSFNLESKNFESIRNQLKEKYGLLLVKRKTNIEHFLIIFPK